MESPVSTAHPESSTATQASEVRKGLSSRQVCPFCGHISDRSVSPCPQCAMEDTPGTRQATRSKLGPWFVLQLRNPAAPGMNFQTLAALIQKGRVTPRSIVRGPTSHQLWRYAAKVKGLSREFGLCWNCGHTIATSAKLCPECKRMQEPPINPDALLEGESLIPHPAPHNTPPAPAAQMLATLPMVQVVDFRPDTSVDLAAYQFNQRRGPRRGGIGKIFLVIFVAAMLLAAAALFIEPRLGRRTLDAVGTWWSQLSGDNHAPLSAPVDPPVAPPPLVKAPVKNPIDAPFTPAAAPTQPSNPPATAQTHLDPTNPPTLDHEAALANARQLYREAIQAEGLHNYTRAIQCYEAILRLPADVRQTDVQNRLEFARSQVK